MKMEEVMDIKSLEKTAAEIRCGIIKAIHNAGSGHPGGLFRLQISLQLLYFDEMNVDPKDPQDEGTGQVHPFQGSCRPGAVFGTGCKRILSDGRFHDA